MPGDPPPTHLPPSPPASAAELTLVPPPAGTRGVGAPRQAVTLAPPTPRQAPPVAWRRRWPAGLLAVLVLGGGLLGAWLGCDTWRLARAGGERGAISLPPGLTELPPPAAPDELLSGPANDALPAPAPPPPDFSWPAPEPRQQAAAWLLEQGDLDGALALLRQDPELRATAEALGLAAWQHAQRLLPGLLAEHLSAAEATWIALDPAAAVALQAPGQPARAEAALATAKTGPLPATAGLAALLSRAHDLPPSLHFVLHQNLLLARPAESPLPASLWRLALAPLRRGEGLAARLLHLPETPSVPIPWSQHLAVTLAALDRQLLLPLVQRLVVAERERLAGDEPVAAWRRDTLGPALVAALAQWPAGDPVAALAQLPTLAPSPIRELWGRRLGRLLLISERLDWPPALLASHPWLGPGLTGPDSAATLRVIRRHPAWQAALAGFDQDAAMDQVAAILADLGADEFTVAAKLALATPLNYEKAQVREPDFPWARLAGLLRLPEAVPPAVLHARSGRPPVPGLVSQWGRVPPAKVLAALQQLTPPARGEDQQRLRLFSETFARNRALLDDPARSAPLSVIRP